MSLSRSSDSNSVKDVSHSSPEGRSRRSQDASDEVAAVILNALSGIRYGTVVIKIHDGDVTQIDRTTRLQIPKKSQLPAEPQEIVRLDEAKVCLRGFLSLP